MRRSRPLRTVLLLGLLAVAGAGGCTGLAPVRSASADRGVSDPGPAIRAVLDAQARAWNAGDLRGFMDGYWRSDSLRFASGGTVRRGWQAALDGYVRSYPNRQAMGRLTFSDLEITEVTSTRATVFGRWRLDLEGTAEAPGGLFTLGFRRFGSEWRIVSDHTSSNGG